jgi:hypothetical protein
LFLSLGGGFLWFALCDFAFGVALVITYARLLRCAPAAPPR